MTGWPIHVRAPCFSQGTTVTVDGNTPASGNQGLRLNAATVLDLRHQRLVAGELQGREAITA